MNLAVRGLARSDRRPSNAQHGHSETMRTPPPSFVVRLRRSNRLSLYGCVHGRGSSP